MYPRAYIDYLIYFHTNRDYFECHEVLEEHWKKQPEKEQVWIVLIQIAVGLYHHRRKNYTGALKMIGTARQEAKLEKERLQSLGLDTDQLDQLLTARYKHIQEERPYESMNLPIQDPKLLELCQQVCAEDHLSWCVPSDLSNTMIIHKHTLRDRSAVIEERQKQKELRESASTNERIDKHEGK